MIKFNLLFNFHLQFTNKSVGYLCFRYENKKIDHPHTAMAYTMAHPMVHPMAYPMFCPYPGKNNRTTKNPEQQRSSHLVVANSLESKEKTNQKVTCEV